MYGREQGGRKDCGLDLKNTGKEFLCFFLALVAWGLCNGGIHGGMHQSLLYVFQYYYVSYCYVRHQGFEGGRVLFFDYYRVKACKYY